MDPEQFSQLMAQLNDMEAAIVAHQVAMEGWARCVEWYGKTLGIAACWLCGQTCWRLVVLAKNQREFF